MIREAKAKSIAFADLVEELRTFLINKTIGNDFGCYCSKHRQPEGHDVATHMATLQLALLYFEKELATKMGRRALFYTLTAHVQQELIDSFRLNLEQVPEPTVLLEQARAAERTLEQRAEVVHHARERGPTVRDSG